MAQQIATVEMADEEITFYRVQNKTSLALRQIVIW